MKNEIKNDLEELVSLIESEEDFAKLIDTTPIQNAINSLASSKNCFYDIQNLSFDINKKIKKIHPDVDKVTLIINNKVHYQEKGGIIYIEGVSKCTPSLFYVQSPDFHKLGLCYYLKILYL